MHHEDIVELRKSIARSFSVPLPRFNHRLTVNGEEGDRFASVIDGREWETLTLEDLKVVPGSILMLNPQAYRYYLPAYLIHSVDNRRGMGPLLDSLVDTFINPGLEEMDLVDKIHMRPDPVRIAKSQAAYLSFWSEFSTEQIDSIIGFMDWLMATEAGFDPLDHRELARESLRMLRENRA